MPTKLTKPVARETALTVTYAGKDRVLNVELTEDKIVFWPKGTQQKVEVSTLELYTAIVDGTLCLKKDCEDRNDCEHNAECAEIEDDYEDDDDDPDSEIPLCPDFDQHLIK